MKKLWLLAVLSIIMPTLAWSQGSTPNIGLQIPATGSNNWYIPLNYNFTKLDQLLSGNLPLLNLSITNSLVVGGTITAGSFTGVGGGTFVTASGSIVPGNCAQWVTSTTLGSASSPCGSGGGGGGGTVTSFSAGSLAALFTTNVATATTTPSLTFTSVTVSSHFVLAGPSSGSTGAYSFRALLPVDLPVATNSVLGIVRGDGTTIINSDGVLSSVGGGITSISVATANGFEGTSSGGSTPTLTLGLDGSHVLPVNSGSSSLYLNQAGTYTTPSGGGGGSNEQISALSCGSSSTVTLPSTGSEIVNVSLTGSCTLSIAAATYSSPYSQRATLVITPNGNTTSLPVSSSSIVWLGGSPPVVSTTQLTTINFIYNGSNPILGNTP